MYIDILNPVAGMSQTGSSLRTMIQNSKDPELDLYVRESLQNSLDAGDNTGARFVKVEYIIGEFDKSSLNKVLSEITDQLDNKFPKERYSYLAVKDMNTTGLTGPLKPSQITENAWGNLEKLVYQICRPQSQLGAGGSWGMGKTVYFRMSEIGLVFYYSRVINDAGSYESRLCAAMVEDENNPDSIIPAIFGNKSGVAWWGAEKGKESHSHPITDDKEIESILKIFDIPPFEPNKTGTVIIIPYIDEQALLNHNKIEYLDEYGNPANALWNNSLEEYLRIAIQRWYAPRLDNPYYYRKKRKSSEKVFKYLKASVNGKEITVDSMEPIFRVIQSLFNEGAYRCFHLPVPEHQYIAGIRSKALDYNRIRGDLGQLSYIMLDKSFLAGSYRAHPFSYLGLSLDDLGNAKDSNMPIVCMTRRPGMIVEYNSKDWLLRDIPTSASDKFILALFVLNSYATFNEDDCYTLEEYIRSKGGENADHLGWNDHPLANGHKCKCVYHIIRKTVDVLKEAFANNKDKEDIPHSGGLGALLGHILHLRPTKKGSGSAVSNTTSQAKEGSFLKYEIVGKKYTASGLSLNISVSTKRPIKKTTLVLRVDSDAQPLTADKWEKETKMNCPFFIKSCQIHVSQVDSKQADEDLSAIGIDNPFSLFKTKWLKTPRSKKSYGIRLITADDKEHNFKAEFSLSLVYVRRDIRPSIDFTC